MAFLEQRLDALDRQWRERGCVSLPLSDTPLADPLTEASTVFALLTAGEVRLSGTRLLNHPGRGRGQWQGLAAAVREPGYQVLLQPGPIDALEIVCASLASFGVEPVAHDVALPAFEWHLEAFGIESVGWKVRVDGNEVGRIGYLLRLAGRTLDPVPLEMMLRLEPLARLADSAVAEELSWGEGVDYSRWRSLEEQQSSQYENRFVATDSVLRVADDRLAEATRCLESGLALPAWRRLTESHLGLELLTERGGLSESDLDLRYRQVAKAVEQCARAMVESSP